MNVRTIITGLPSYGRKLKNMVFLRQVLQLRDASFFSDFQADLRMLIAMDNDFVYIPHNALGDRNKRSNVGIESLCFMLVHAANDQPVFCYILADWHH